uniref:Terpene synthase N-terminal domain-containing protein n=1 Tax=Leersia perrieri TaxID=77586 RepID=A0A0D9W3J5_9ORYZ
MVWHKPAAGNAYSLRTTSKCKRTQSVSCHAHATAPVQATVEAAASFEPSQSEQWMRERASKLKEDVRALFMTSKDDILVRMKLVDTVQHLGMDHLFKEEIECALKDIYEKELASSDLHEVALRFHLLREHGYFVSPDVFNKFKGDDGTFSNELADDPRGLLSLYNAAHLFIHGEPELDEAISFARRHLESITQHNVLNAPLADQVKRALHWPRPRTHKRVEMVSYISEYDQEDGHNPVLLELAKLDFNILQRVHLKELKEISRWWKDISGYMGLSHIRDRVIECYTWSYAVYHEEDLALARMIFAKIVVFVALLDDTYDVHAYTSIEECRMLNAAFQGWDDSAVSLVPEYLRKFYEVTLRSFREFEEQVPSNQKYLVAFSKTELQKLSSYYLEGAEWSHRKHKPSFSEQVTLSTMTTGTRPLAAGLMVGMSDAVTTKEAYVWAVASTDAIISCGKTGRFMNDIAGFKLGSQNKADMACSVESYINEHKVTADVAIAKINELLEDEWKTTNQARIDHHAVLPVVQRLINITMAIPLYYGDGNDGFTFGESLQKVLQNLYVRPIPI